jgi:hypothetical protein
VTQEEYAKHFGNAKCFGFALLRISSVEETLPCEKCLSSRIGFCVGQLRAVEWCDGRLPGISQFIFQLTISRSDLFDKTLGGQEHGNRGDIRQPGRLIVKLVLNQMALVEICSTVSIVQWPDSKDAQPIWLAGFRTCC